MNSIHQPVLLNEAIKLLNIQKDSWYIDCNFGSGGHTKAILEKGGKVLAIDLDAKTIEAGKLKFNDQTLNDRLVFCQSNFTHLAQLVNQNRLNPISGVLFDLGLSSDQLADPEFGFSFQIDAPLDMRLDKNLETTAADLVNGLYPQELEKLFQTYGEEAKAKTIALAITSARNQQPITTTAQLVRIIESVKPRRLQDKIHPATKVFQALRIAVNDEINNLKQVLPQALEVLDSGGRLVVISFHSLEDRVVKDFFRQQEEENKLKILTKKPVTSSVKEVRQNPRSRSAKLRAAVKEG